MNLHELIIDNPVLTKHVRSRLRKGDLLPPVMLVIVLSILIDWAASSMGDASRANQLPFLTMLWLQCGILFLCGTNQVSASIRQARENGVLDFHRIAPQSALSTAVGFVFGAPVREWILFCCTLPVSAVAAMQAHISVSGYFEILFVIALSAVLYQAAGAYFGTVSSPGRGAPGGGMSLAILLNVPSLALGSYGALKAFGVSGTVVDVLGRSSGQPATVNTFFGIVLPNVLQVTLHQVPLIALLLVPVVRRMRSETTPPYPKPLAVAAVFTICLLVLGDLWRLPSSDYLLGVRTIRLFQNAPLLITSYCAMLVGITLVLCTTPMRGQIANGVRRALKRKGTRAPFWSDMAPNWSTLLSISLVGALFAAIAGVREGQLRMGLATGLIVGLVTYGTGSAVQYFRLVAGSRSDAYFGILVFGAWIAPLIISLGLTSNESFRNMAQVFTAFSPLTAIATVVQQDNAASASEALSSSLLIAVFFTCLRLRAESAAVQSILKTAAAPGGDNRRTRLRTRN